LNISLLNPGGKEELKNCLVARKLDFGALLFRELRQLERLSRFQISLPGGDTEGLLPRTQGSCCRGALRPVVGAQAPIDLYLIFARGRRRSFPNWCCCFYDRTDTQIVKTSSNCNLVFACLIVSKLMETRLTMTLNKQSFIEPLSQNKETK